MPTIQQASRFVRSKNAGPFWLTIDIFCDDKASYETICSSPTIQPHVFAKVFDVGQDLVKLYYVPNLNVIKISIPRIPPQGDKYERDMHCGQQFVKILDLEL